MPAEMHLPTFFVKQKFAMTTNVYQLFAANPDGSFGALMGFAQQKRMAFKEEVTFYADETKARKVFSFKARKRVDLNAGYDIFDEQGVQLGFFKKDFGKSLMRSTFHLEGPGYAGTGQERSQAIAIIRRFTDIPFLPIHFDFVDAQGQALLGVERQGSVRDKYTVHVPHPEIDFRVAAAVAVGLDALMQR
jgi:hypothetical protein